MAKRFTKKMVETINEAFGGQHTLTEEEVENGEVETMIRGRFSWMNDEIIHIKRYSDGSLGVTVRYDWDPYCFVDATFEKPDAQFLKACRYH